MKAADETLLRHWIYVLEAGDLTAQAHAWQRRKTAQGKWYQLIDPSCGGELRQVGNHDVLYLLARSVQSMPQPAELAAHLLEHGLDRAHRAVKVFASHSGDTGYAEKLYQAMLPEYPDVVVYGYGGEVTADGFSGHKTAGLNPGETPDRIGEEEWNRRRLRAKDNRVRFPPEPRVD